jgi:hypothetical protein
VRGEAGPYIDALDDGDEDATVDDQGGVDVIVGEQVIHGGPRSNQRRRAWCGDHGVGYGQVGADVHRINSETG